MTFINKIRSVVQRELIQFKRFPILMTISILLPLLSIGLFILIFESGVPRDMPIGVIDYDNSSLSTKVIRMIDATPSARVTLHLSDELEGETMMKRGEIDAFVIIPRNFERSILRTEPVEVAAFVNGLNLTKAGLLDKDIRQTVMTFSSGIQIQLLVKKGLSTAEAYSQMMPVTFEKHILFNPYTNYALYLLPAFLPMMMLLFILITTIFVVGVELKRGTAGEWLDSAQGSILAALWGKLAPYTIIHLVLWAFMNTLIYRVEGVPLNGSVMMLIVGGVLFVIAYQSVGVFIITVLSNLRLALSLGGGYSVLAFTFSGLTFPFMAMDPMMRYFGKIFPFTYYMELFVDQAIRGASSSHSIGYVLSLVIFIALPYLTLPRLKRIVSDPSFWGRV
ncbi:MAG: ABC transporter permease [Bacteroidales bacterium]